MKKVCKYCGLEFEDTTSNRNKIYCSRLCGQRSYRQENADRRRESIRHWRQEHPASVSASNQRAYAKRQKPRIKLSDDEKKCRAKNHHYDYVKNNSEKVQKYQKEYRAKNHLRIKQQKRQWFIDHYGSDIQFRLICVVRSRFKQAIKTNAHGGLAIELLGCSIGDFKAHIETLFEPWMTWDNWGRYDKNRKTWHIDHIMPLSVFDLTDPEQLKKACHYTNLRPLIAVDNLSKGKKILTNLKGDDDEC